MGQPYVGEIRIFAGNFAPAGWMLCEGQIVSIAENETLFNLIGTTYGGDGQVTFALPDLRGRLPVHQGNGVVLADAFGSETVTLTTQQLPAHSHDLTGSVATASKTSPAGNLPARSANIDLYVADVPTVNMAPGLLSNVGGNQPHSNLQPYLCLNFIISLFGIYPSQI